MPTSSNERYRARVYRGRVNRILFAAASSVAGVALACSPEPSTSSDSSPEGDAGRAHTISAPTPGLSFGPIGVDDYCDSLSRTECHRIVTCAPVRASSVYGTLEACEVLRREECEGAYVEEIARQVIALGLVDYDPAAMGAAMTEHSRRHCNSAARPPSVLIAATGKITEGRACPQSEVCETGFCDFSLSGGCGLCAPLVETPLTECPSTCPFDHGCLCEGEGAKRRCACQPALVPGSDCTATPTLCREGSTCLPTSRTGDVARFTCIALPLEGQGCGPSRGASTCVGEAYCDLATDSGVCKRPVLTSIGSLCDGTRRLCPSGADCRGICVPRANFGDACIPRLSTTIPDAGPPTCVEGPCNGTCALPRNQNEFCQEAGDCGSDLGCFAWGIQGGSCQTDSGVREQLRTLLTCPL